jgi:glycerophosphoryl diester phosphodiesterase
VSRYLLNEPGGPLAGAVLGFAHRGGGSQDENTLAAFTAAAAEGFAYLETDVRLSSDGVLYAFHDATVDRVTDGSGAVAELSSGELDALRVHGPAAEPPARFEDLLRALPRAHWNVDLKSDGAAEALVRIVAEAGAQDRVLVASFASSHRRRAQALMPELAGSAGPWLVAASVVLGPLAVPLLRRAKAKGIVALQVPVRQYGVRVVRAAWVRRLHAAGVQAHVWVIDEARQMRELVALGVDGLMTDRPEVLAGVLRERGQWPQARD